MAAANSSQGGMAMNMAPPGLPTLAPAPPQQHPQAIQTSQIQQLHPGQGTPAPHQTMAGQPMTLQQGIGQPQFVIQQPTFAGGQQYTTFPQFAYTNQQGQLVLQPAQQFSIPGAAAPGQPQGQQVILTNVPQKPGQPQMMVSTPGAVPGKPGQPSYTITSSGPIQMPGAGQPGAQPQTFMITNPMGQVSMPAPSGQNQVLPTSMTGMKGADGKPVNCPPAAAPMQPGPPNQQQFVIPSPGMTYMPATAGPQQIIQNGQQLIFRAPVPPEQQVMFSPSGQAPPQTPHQMPTQNQMPPGPNNPVGGMQMTGPRPQTPAVPPPGKTAISRAIAPLPTTITQTGARAGLNTTTNAPGQPSPKSKQKMSPRGGGNGVGRPPAPKNNQMKMMPPRMAGVGAGAVTSVPMSGSMPPGPQTVQTNMLRAPLPAAVPQVTSQQQQQQQIMSGPPTLSPMMVTSDPNHMVQVPQSMVSSVQSIPQMSTISTVPTPSLSTAIPVSTVSSVPTSKPSVDTALDPPTLTKEINTSMPNLGQPNAPLAPVISRPPPVSKPIENGDNTSAPASTPKAVVKPQVVTHVIDGHVIKESSQPFPVSPVKAPTRRKDKTDDGKTTNTGGVKRGPGRPPGSTNNKSHDHHNKNVNSIEPAEKKLKMKDDLQPAVPVSLASTNLPPPPAGRAVPAPPPATGFIAQPLTGNPALVQQPIQSHQQQPQPILKQPPQPQQPPASQTQQQLAPLQPQQPQQQANAGVASTQQQQVAPAPPQQPPSPKPQPTLLSTLKGNPLKWNVTEVCDFVKSLQGCDEYVEDFAQQEIDGQALMLLKVDHLMSAMSIKLGPALKICSHIEQIREELARL
eukprot:TRINITY_DN5358_c0_g1_i8.p1 TRINITY_DN5358_c0_g1~~TRINITY_DN5358_c0_g1_i8.p1  ORF type:complete len:846 (-),score=250.25 TRINITY_DN5358_c0_g1_i8:301-2838(-)